MDRFWTLIENNLEVLIGAGGMAIAWWFSAKTNKKKAKAEVRIIEADAKKAESGVTEITTAFEKQVNLNVIETHGDHEAIMNTQNIAKELRDTVAEQARENNKIRACKVEWIKKANKLDVDNSRLKVELKDAKLIISKLKECICKLEEQVEENEEQIKANQLIIQASEKQNKEMLHNISQLKTEIKTLKSQIDGKQEENK